MCIGSRPERQPRLPAGTPTPKVVFGDTYWIYPTYSADYDEQTFLDAFSSKDSYTGRSTPGSSPTTR